MIKSTVPVDSSGKRPGTTAQTVTLAARAVTSQAEATATNASQTTSITTKPKCAVKTPAPHAQQEINVNLASTVPIGKKLEPRISVFRRKIAAATANGTMI